MNLEVATEAIDPGLDLFDEIERLKRERNAIIMAHYYQEPTLYIGNTFCAD